MGAEIEGVAPPLETIGAVPVTAETPEALPPAEAQVVQVVPVTAVQVRVCSVVRLKYDPPIGVEVISESA